LADPDKHGLEPSEADQRPLANSKATGPGQTSVVATCGSNYIYGKLIKNISGAEEEKDFSSY